MSPSLMNPAAAPFFFGAFEAIPQTGAMTVPVQLHPLSNVTEARELSPQTAGPFMRTLGAAISEINTLFLPGLGNVPLPGGWTAFSSGSKHLVMENHPEGKSLRFDRGGRLTEQLTGHATGLDPGSLSLGQLCETLALEAYPTDPADQRLPAPLVSLWGLAESLAERYRAEDDSTEALSKDYFRSTRKIYGSSLVSPGPDDVN